MDKTLSELTEEISREYEKLSGIEQGEVQKALATKSVKNVSNPVVSALVKKILQREDSIMTGKAKEPVAKVVDEKVSDAEPPKAIEIAKLPETALAEKKGCRNLNLQEVITLAGILFKARLFKDLQSAEQAVAIIIAGQELGLAPVYALAHLYMIPGKAPATDAQCMGNMLRKAGYSYKALEHVIGKKWKLGFYKGNEFLGESQFTIEEAQNAQLTGKAVWKSYGDDLLFCRTLSRGARKWTPDALGGIGYLVEELDIEVGAYTPSNIIVEGDNVIKDKNEPKALGPSSEAKPEPPTREELLQKLVEKHGKAKVKENKDKLKIEGSLKTCEDSDWKKLVKALNTVFLTGYCKTAITCK